MKKKVTKQLQKSRNRDILSLEKRLNSNLSEVLEWFVEKKSTTIIQEQLKEKFGITISRMGIWRFSQSRKWKPIIERGRMHLAKHISLIPCANKENRLLFLQKVIEEGLKWSLKNITKEGQEIYELKLGAVTEAIRASREEIEKLGIKEDDPMIKEEIELIPNGGNGKSNYKNRFARFINN